MKMKGNGRKWTEIDENKWGRKLYTFLYVPFLNPGPAQRNCEPCVTVPGDSSDPLVGIYR